MLEIFYFDGKVKQTSELSKLRNKKVWIDVTNLTVEEAELLEKQFNLHHLTTEDLLHTRTRIKIEKFPHYLFCVFYGITRASSLQLTEIDFILGKNFIISNHHPELAAAQELKQHPEKMATLFRRGVEFIFHRLLDAEIDNYFPVLAYIDDKIEVIEETIKHPRPGISQQIIQLKRQIMEVKKTALAQREKISQLAKEEYVSAKAFPYFRDAYDHSIRVADTIENYREALNSTFEAYMSAVSLNMNEVMKVLSVITTLAMPMTVISSIYGTNFTFLPGAGTPYGFWLMIIMTLLLMIALLYFFKRRRWF
ncbi:magnesium/cobalt transporter CorA [Candidatus Woesearchaeota archaeon]|nr:magnesium/cobalt transporter CorA [Candidatus Woesearchaeota archaeon]